MIEYKLIDGGYEIYVDGAKTIYQPHSPTRGLDVPLTEAQAERLAKLVCKKLELGADVTVESSEEKELMTTVSDSRIQEIAAASLEKSQKIALEPQYSFEELKKDIRDIKAMIEQLLAGGL